MGLTSSDRLPACHLHRTDHIERRTYSQCFSNQTNHNLFHYRSDNTLKFISTVPSKVWRDESSYYVCIGPSTRLTPGVNTINAYYTAPDGTVRRKRAELGDIAHAHPKIDVQKNPKKKMNDAELYHSNNTLQKRDAVDCLEHFASKIRWRKKGARVIDIGCGDGTVTAKLLKEYIPENFEVLVGCDISEKMVAFANGHHSDSKTRFFVLNIERPLPDDIRSTFDNVFSFYTLHWIKNQELAFRNIYDMLLEGGECLLTFLGHNPIFDVYRILAQTNKWGSWLRTVDKFISPYHDAQKPENEVRRIMQSIGFSEIFVETQEKLYVYDSPDSVKKAVQAINPFNMPIDVFDEFMIEYLDVLRDMKCIDEANNNKPANVWLHYKLIVAHGVKPLHIE